MIAPRGFLLQLHQDVVGQAARAETEPMVAEPFLTELLLHHHQIVKCLLAGSNAPGRFHGDHLAGLQVVITNSVQHHQGHFHGGRRADLSSAGLDEIRTRRNGDVARQTNFIVGAEFAGLEDHFQPCLSTRFFDRCDLVKNKAVLTTVEVSTTDHHVDLIRSFAHRELGIGDLHGLRCLATGEGSRHGCDQHTAIS